MAASTLPKLSNDVPVPVDCGCGETGWIAVPAHLLSRVTYDFYSCPTHPGLPFPLRALAAARPSAVAA